MTGLFGQRQKRTISILLIAIMAALMINKVVYTHIHVLYDGSVTKHAHPFSKSPQGNPDTTHQHSSIELFLLDHADILILLVGAAAILDPLAASSRFVNPVTDPSLIALVPLKPGRAPPTCM